ncbi:Meiotically up-regulated gene 151 protein [Colletotrichum trifolii]|uniref:Meiotically up-regulated gene 151 protein n=1 Tax=Colletotrichum trifolii TaxID=5466 RepID=A0A4R8RKA0_COLTR|nr:Meiotically up-regulated gene 151 protein [Colletotrichum trifolii]
MAGLVSYASSDEEDEVQETVPQKTETLKEVDTSTQPKQNEIAKSQEALQASQPFRPAPSEDAITIGPVHQSSVPLGPSLPTLHTQQLHDPSLEQPSSQTPSRPSSPYSASRAALHSLTLPPVPDLNIPPSPPSSPAPPAALTAKLTQFLELKKEGVHFNAKLAQSAALRNPSLTDKLLSFVDLDGRADYATTLPAELWNPTSTIFLPESASRAALRQSQDRVRAERERAARKPGAPVDFVPAAGAASGNGVPPPGSDAAEIGGLRPGKRKAGGW